MMVGADMRIDRRAELLYEVKSMPVGLSIPFVYPRMVCVSDYVDQVCCSQQFA